ncbi:16S rRNA (guanine(527)-N(7))-methyltransferase RsmG [Congregibacter brevis]|uniref:Ribosomal RNA small subunit methyltransferase G n=1 Tax=Congregibacter brevis TaxID=3081201 RepID=A0ABZ0IFH8_9GAMM|nr:16S rRNA (guanine(527)-N(7))-methyltransferase RsmG [Congregibacter sp. IMCC45268]
MRSQLSQGLSGLDIDLSEAQQDLLIQYLELLSRWNKTYNLTAIRDESSMVTKHLLDSLAVLPHLRGRRFIDVGTGAGLPGIPLAIASPERHFSLLDSNGKKTRFLVHAANELALGNVEVVKSRVADFVPKIAYDGVLSRAFASLDDMIDGCRHMLTSSGEFFAMKGQRPDEELKQVDTGLMQVSVVDLQVPGLSEYRCLLRICPRENLEHS